jgi:hypothetical protein
MGSVIHTVGDVGYAPLGITSRNTYYGIYATDTFDITDPPLCHRRRALQYRRYRRA